MDRIGLKGLFMSEIIPKLRKELSIAANKKNVSIEELEASDQILQGWKARPRIQDDPEVRAVEAELPGFTLYLTALQSVILFGGMIRRHPLLKDLNQRIAKAEALYGTEPAARLITSSFFNSWEFFDAHFGKEEGTLGSLYLEFTEDFGVPPELTEVVARCCASRLGVYQHLGKQGDVMELQDLASGIKTKVVNPRGYLGRKGDIWLARLYPSMAEGASLCMTTPYVIRETTAEQWKAFFNAIGVKGSGSKLEASIRAVMKYPKKPFFWFDYIIASASTDGVEGDHLILHGMPSVK